MHKFVLRLRKDIFDLVRVEANSRGISINDFIVYCLEVAMAEYMNESAEAFKDMVKDKAIQKERKKIKDEQESWETILWFIRW